MKKSPLSMDSGDFSYAENLSCFIIAPMFTSEGMIRIFVLTMGFIDFIFNLTEKNT
jgi:hypothetical protein